MWSKGRLLEPSWLGSRLDSPEDLCVKIFDFFSQPIFFAKSRFFFLLFLSIHFPVFVTSTALLLPLDSRHLPPPYCTHVLPLCLPTLPPHPRLRPPTITPSKPCRARINSLPPSSPRHSAVVSGPPTRPPCVVRRVTGAPPTAKPPYHAFLISRCFLFAPGTLAYTALFLGLFCSGWTSGPKRFLSSFPFPVVLFVLYPLSPPTLLHHPCSICTLLSL